MTAFSRMQAAFNAIHVHKTVSACLSDRLPEYRFVRAKTLRLGDGANVGFVSSGSKLAGMIVIVEESVSVTQCALASKICAYRE